MKSITDPRHNARKLALASIFSWLFSEPDQTECLNLSKSLFRSVNTDFDMAKRIIEGVRSNRKEIDDLIRKNAPEWPLDKVAKIDLVVLRIAVFEILFEQETPEKVAVDEAVELAKEFGNETSSKFVNGVLGSIIKDK